MRLLLLAVSLFLFLILNAVGVGAQTTDDHGNYLNNATNLPLGSSVAGRIDPGDDVDVFKLDLSGRSGTTDVWIYTTGELDTVGWLYDASDELVAYDYDLATDQDDNFHLRAILPIGVYYLEVRSEGVGTGDYTLHAEIATDAGSTTGTATTLTLDVPTTGTIETSEDADYFMLDLDAPMHLFIYAKSGGGESIDGAMLDADGVQVGVNVYPMRNGRRVELERPSERDGFRIEDDFGAGTHYLRVNTPDYVESHPISYIIYAYEDTDYPQLVDYCETKTRSLNDRQISDPLYGCQWHLNNPDGEDINVDSVWSSGIDGAGVNIAVVDDGLDHSHED